MSARTRSIGWLVASLVVMSACSGGGGASTAATSPGSSVAASEVPSAGTSDAPSAAASAAASAATSPAAGASGACGLVSAEELSGILGFDVSVAQDDSTICIYEVPATGALVAYAELQPDAGAIWETVKTAPEVTPVTGVGDEALWQPANEAVKLFVLKGDSVLSLAVGTLSGVPIDELPTGTSPDDLLDLAKQMGTLAASRM